MKSRTKSVQFSWTIADHDVKVVQRLLEAQGDTEFVRKRRTRNVAMPPPDFSRSEFWLVLMGCLLTTQQRSTKGSPVNLFVESEIFPLSLEVCEKQVSVKKFVLTTITDFKGIHRQITIANQAADNWRQLNRVQWGAVQEWFERLRGQRAREPRKSDQSLEREAARWADSTFAGLGPKQSRNLWQWLGLTRYEIPLDSRVTAWINRALSVKVNPKRLGQLVYYESVLDYVEAICDKANVLPCQLDAAAFDYEDLGGILGPIKVSTQSGFVNPLGQITVRNTTAPGTDHLQYVYQLACSQCGHTYGANGSDIHDRKCPKCQAGSPGFSIG